MSFVISTNVQKAVQFQLPAYNFRNRRLILRILVGKCNTNTVRADKGKYFSNLHCLPVILRLLVFFPCLSNNGGGFSQSWKLFSTPGFVSHQILTQKRTTTTSHFHHKTNSKSIEGTFTNTYHPHSIQYWYAFFLTWILEPHSKEILT